ncbi:hypothetical protein BGM19_03550 [Streptomyces agglomeratus]|nr:hypothetical protein BGM19_03550 [Streptomyces agglomeratus]
MGEVVAVRIRDRQDTVGRKQINTGEGSRPAAGLLDERAALRQQDLRGQPLAEHLARFQRVGLPVEEPQERVIGEGLLELALFGQAASEL